MDTSKLPETQYAQSGDFSIAYQVVGDGPVDIILVPGIISHIDFQHELPTPCRASTTKRRTSCSAHCFGFGVFMMGARSAQLRDGSRPKLLLRERSYIVSV